MGPPVDASTLLTAHLELRLLDADRAADARLYRALYTCPTVMAEIGPPLTADAATAAFARVCRHNALDAPGHRAWTVARRRDEVPVGLVVLHRRGERAELGLMLLPAAWNGRVSTEALAPVIRYGFEVVGLAAIDAGCRDGRNTRVLRRLLARFGFDRISEPRPGFADWTLPRERWVTLCEALSHGNPANAGVRFAGRTGERPHEHCRPGKGQSGVRGAGDDAGGASRAARAQPY